MVGAFGIDELDAGNTDFPVGTRAVFDGGFRFEGSANGRVLLELFRLVSNLCVDRAVCPPFLAPGGNVLLTLAKSIARRPEKITTCPCESESGLALGKRPVGTRFSAGGRTKRR